MCSLYYCPGRELGETTPYALRAIVLDYLAHRGYTNTAAAFVRESTVRHLTRDGDEIAPDHDLPPAEVARIHQRKQICTHIHAGRLDDATSLLNSHFPTVLAAPPPSPSIYASPTSTDPNHIALNLRVQAFIEACRTRPLPDDDDVHLTPPLDQMSLLNMAQKLLAHAHMLPSDADRKLYIAELQNVGGLLAYKVPEESSMRKYLAQERRDAVADQVHRAILEHSGVCSISSLELIVRYTSSLWYFANKMDVMVRPGALLPRSQTKELETVPTFDLGLFLDQKS